MRKFFFIVLTVILGIAIVYYLFIYYASFSQGYRAGELVKFSHKGVIFKTWEGELSYGVSEAQRFEFSVEGNQKELIQKLSDMQGEEVKLTYKQRFGTFPWLGDTKHFAVEVELQKTASEKRQEEEKQTLQEILR
ncbi:MAG: 6-phosphogluconate dehydrogenase [Flavobacteriales bacterium]|nr:MAG: 6-phosphogluconate dehydrogenase [Flavobacteriales bacterium]